MDRIGKEERRFDLAVAVTCADNLHVVDAANGKNGVKREFLRRPRVKRQVSASQLQPRQTLHLHGATNQAVAVNHLVYSLGQIHMIVLLHLYRYRAFTAILKKVHTT